MSHPGLPRRRSSAASGRSLRRRESMSTTITGMTDGSEWDDGELGDDDEDDEELDEWEGGVGGTGSASVGNGTKLNGRKKKDEPMSPVAVVLYVVCFYLIWQILTRSDENEHLSHLSPSALVHPSSAFDLGPNGGGASPYHMPYQFPHIPSPIPPSTSTSTTSSGGTSTWRLVLGVAVYPVYIAITLVAMPLPFLLNALYLVFGILGTVLYPFTSTIRLLTRTFLYTPLGIARSILAAFYPVYVFVGGVVGVGCVMGLGAGWAGKLGFDLITGKSRRSKHNGSSSKSSKSRRSKSMRTKSSSSSRHRSEHRDREQAVYPEGSKANAPAPMPVPAPGPVPIIAHPQPLRGRSIERDLLDRWSRGELHYKETYGSPPSDDSSAPLHTPQDDMRATLPDVPYPYFTTKPERRKSRLSFGDLEDGAAKAGSTRGVGTAREPVVVGVRRRGLRADLSVPR